MSNVKQVAGSDESSNNYHLPLQFPAFGLNTCSLILDYYFGFQVHKSALINLVSNKSNQLFSAEEL